MSKHEFEIKTRVFSELIDIIGRKLSVDMDDYPWDSIILKSDYYKDEDGNSRATYTIKPDYTDEDIKFSLELKNRLVSAIAREIWK